MNDQEPEAKRNFWGALSQGLAGMIKPAEKEPEIHAQEFLDKAKSCLDPMKSLHARRGAAAELAKELRIASSSKELLTECLGALSVGLAAEKAIVREAIERIDWSDVDMPRIEASLAAALGGRRRELIRLWMSMDGALEFLVWLRMQTLALGKNDAALDPLRKDLDGLMGEIFAQGLLHVKQVSWNSPARILEKIIKYERVHKLHSWDELKSRLGRDRRVFATFHSGWDGEPLAFLELALTKGMAKSVGELLAPAQESSERPDTATFYSINSPHQGLKGISLGEDLIRHAVLELGREMPWLKAYCTLSPIPGFASWLDKLDEAQMQSLAGADACEKLRRKFGPDALRLMKEALAGASWSDGPWGEGSREMLERLCAKYLASFGPDGQRLDPVARFHLGNGARIEALRHLGDASASGLRQSHGMMVNYFYDWGELEKNKLAASGETPGSWRFKRLAS